jgi:hypothetical protein
VLSPAGAVIFWHVDDLPETLAKLESMGARILGKGSGAWPR